MSSTDANAIENQISERLRKLTLKSKNITEEIFRKNAEVKSLKSEIKEDYKKLQGIQ